MEPTISFGERLRARRAELGLTLLAVATDAGLSLPYVANLEKGRGNPTLDAIVALAAALRIGPAELLAADHPAGEEIDDVWVGLPPVLVEFAHGKILASQTESLAERCQLGVAELRHAILRAMAAAPRPSVRPLNEHDCRRLLDAYRLILTDPDET